VDREEREKMAKFEVLFKCPSCDYIEPEWREVPANTYTQALGSALTCPIHEEHEMIVDKVREIKQK